MEPCDSRAEICGGEPSNPTSAKKFFNTGCFTGANFIDTADRYDPERGTYWHHQSKEELQLAVLRRARELWKGRNTPSEFEESNARSLAAMDEVQAHKAPWRISNSTKTKGIANVEM